MRLTYSPGAYLKETKMEKEKEMIKRKKVGSVCERERESVCVRERDWIRVE